MNLGHWMQLGNLFPKRKVCSLLLGLMYLFQPHLWLCLFVCLGLGRPYISLCRVSDLILDLIHFKIVMIDLTPLFCHLYFLQIFLDPSETTITVMVNPIIMMMTMLRKSAVMNSVRIWSLAMMRLSVKMPILGQCSPLSVVLHLFYSHVISDRMVAKALDRSLVSRHWWLEWWEDLACSVLSLHSSGRCIVQVWCVGHQK